MKKLCKKRNTDFELLKKIIGKIQLSKIRAMFLVLGVLVSSIITFVRPQIVSTLTDNGLVKKNWGIVIWWCIILIICAAIEYGNGLAQIKICVEINNQFVSEMYQRALNKIIKAPYVYSQNRTSAELLSTINNDISRVALLLDRSSLLMIQFLFQIIGGTIGLVLLNWRIAFLLLIIIIIKQFLVNWLANNKTKLTEIYINEQQKFGTWFGDQINGILEIKLWNLYFRKNQEFFECYKNIPEINEKLEMCDGFENILETATGVIIEILIYLVCGYLVCTDNMSIGNLLAFISYAMYVSNPLAVFSNIPYIWAQIKPSAKRFMELLDWPEEELKNNIQIDLLQSDLELKNVNFKYDESHTILKDVNLKIPEGSRIAIVGDNGSGKTTIMNLLLGIILPDRGTISMGNKTIWEIGLNEWRNQFAVVGQKGYLFQGTIKDNIDLGSEKTDEEIIKMAKQLDINLNIGHHDKGYSYLVQDNGINLSGGEKQKIIFLRAFMKKSKIIILDEMFSNCDEESRRKIRNIVFDSGLKKTVILISHYKEDIADVDVVYELKDGVLIKNKVEDYHER